MVATVRPAEDFGAVIAREDHDGVLRDVEIVELLEQLTFPGVSRKLSMWYGHISCAILLWY
jgi:hypothetical protein